VNGDGKIDLIISDASNNTISIVLGNGNGTFGTRTTIATGGYPFPNLADLNGDGVTDIISADYTGGTIGIYLANSTTATSATTVSILTQSLAEDLIAALDSTISSLSDSQANLSAIHSRLNHSIAGNLLLSENLEAARSAAIDTDYALEIAELVRNQILQSAQIAVLGQANIQQELILRLLDTKN
jgi:flagellin